MNQITNPNAELEERLESGGTAAESYLGEKGAKYFAEHFQPHLTFARRYQARYFLPYCDRQSLLLDFGCGDGTILRELPAARKIGIELNPLCRQKVNEANESLLVPVEFHESIEAVEDDSVTVAISNHCLEHVEAPINTLRTIRAKLVSGGRLVLVTPYDDWRSVVHRHWAPDDPDHHLQTWSPMNLGNLVAAAGFEVEESRICTFTMSPKLFFVHRVFGDAAFRFVCRLFSIYRCRREVVCVGRKP